MNMYMLIDLAFFLLEFVFACEGASAGDVLAVVVWTVVSAAQIGAIDCHYMLEAE